MADEDGGTTGKAATDPADDDAGQQGEVHADLVGSIDAVTAAIEALKAATAATPAAAPAAPATAGSAPAPTGQCCGAYPAEALKEALELPAVPKALPKGLTADQLDEFQKLNAKVVDARIELLQRSAWATAPEMVLLDACAEQERAGLAKRILEVRAGATDPDGDRRKAEAKLAEEKAAIAGVARETLKVAKTQMEKWTKLAEKGRDMLVVSTFFSMVMIVAVIIFASENKLDGTETPIIIFVLAIFAISPAVLLLRERPLEGLDKFTPSGPTGGASGSSGDSGEEDTAK